MNTYLTGEPTDDAANELIALRAEVERLTRERNEARAEIERRRAKSVNNDWLLAEVERLQGLLKGLGRDMAEEIERLTRELNEARAALKPFSELYLWPDDTGRLLAERVRAREDWDEEANDDESNAYCILRGYIRAARKALESKP